MAVILPTLLLPIQKKPALKQMGDHFIFSILLYILGYHLSLGSTFCSPSQVAMDVPSGKGTVFPEVTLQLQKPVHF